MYWEDVAVDRTFETAARTVTEADIVNFAGVSGDFNPVHTDALFAADSLFGQRIAHGVLGLSVATGLLSRTALLGPTAVAFLGINNWRFETPILIGDTLRVRATVTGKRPTRAADRGILYEQLQLVNQHDTVVQSGEFVVLVERQPTTQKDQTYKPTATEQKT
jgi:acyl dehydratase